MKLFVAVLAALLTVCALAREPHWTPQEHIQQRAAVLRGVVVDVTKEKKITEFSDVMRATIQILSVSKAHESLPKETVTVYYECSSVAGRCPTYAVLTKGQSATFYLCHHEYLTGQKDFILEMGQDVEGFK